MKNYLKEIKKIQFEISSMCNALCLGCVRTDPNNFSQTIPDLPKKKIMDLDIFESIIKDPYFKNTQGNCVEFCGTVDEPLMHPQWLEILEVCVKHQIDRIDVHTNVGVRNPDDWREMRRLLKKTHNRVDPDDVSTVRFNIDGLEDTNHLYRQNISWKKVMENAFAFLEEDGGRYAKWQMIVFPWNQHQIDQVKQLAHKMGFSRFVLRHDRSILVRNGLTLEKIKQIQKEYNQNRDIEDNSTLIKKFSKMAIQEQEINCIFQNEGMVFVDYESRLWPCCFIRNPKLVNPSSIYSEQINRQFYEKYNDQNWNRLDQHTLTEIMNHPLYQNDLVSCWNDPVPDLTNGWKKYKESNKPDVPQRILKCSQTCGKKTLEKMPVGGHEKTKLWKYYSDGRSPRDLLNE